MMAQRSLSSDPTPHAAKQMCKDTLTWSGHIFEHSLSTLPMSLTLYDIVSACTPLRMLFQFKDQPCPWQSVQPLLMPTLIMIIIIGKCLPIESSESSQLCRSSKFIRVARCHNISQVSRREKSWNAKAQFQSLIISQT